MIDLHTHTIFSDGVLIPAELVRRAEVIGYKALCMTDHADEATMYHILENVLRFVKKHSHFFDVTVLAGVELTHVPPALIGEMTVAARKAGAQLGRRAWRDPGGAGGARHQPGGHRGGCGPYWPIPV